MKKPIIKNWMRYWATTLAVSGMLAMGACSSSQTAANDTNRTDTTEGTVATDNTTYGTETTTGTTGTQTGTTTGTQTGTQTGTTTGTTDTQTGTTGEYGTTGQENVSDRQQGDQQYGTQTQQDGTTLGTTTRQDNQDMNTGQTGQTSGTSYEKPWEDPNKRATGFDAHIREFSEVNDAIEQVLAERAREERENFMAQQGNQQNYGTQGNQNMATSGNQNQQQDGLTYDRMSDAQQNQYDRDTTAQGTTTGTQTGTSGTVTQTDTSAQDVNYDQTSGQQTGTNRQNMNITSEQEVSYDQMGNTAPEGNTSMIVYEAYINDPEMPVSIQERMFLEESRNTYQQQRESNRGQMDTGLNAYYMPVVEARPDVNYEELAEEISEEINLPDELKDAKVEGTLLVQFIVDENGDIQNAEVIDGILGQRGDDGNLTNTMRLNEAAKEGVVDEIENEDLIEFSEEDRNRISEALRTEGARAVGTTSGRWQPAMQDEKPVRMVMVMPIRFSLED